MLWNAKNGSVAIGDTEMCWVSFGCGDKPFVILPGLSDGLMTVKVLEIIKVEGVPFEEYQRMMDNSDAIMDQLYSYTPAMNALLAMSKGIIVIGGGEEENYEILGERELRPIVNVQPNYDSVRNELEQLVLHPERIATLKRQSQEYVNRHHDYLKVARQYEQLYNGLTPNPSPEGREERGWG